MENCTKTAYLGDNSKPTLIPLIQPSKEILVEVAQYLKNNLDPKQRLLKCAPDSVAKFWKNIAKECGFKYLSPHQWKHSYATIGALHFHDWYRGNIYNLQVCCQHEDIRMTMKYVNQKSDEFLKGFEE